MVLVTLKSFCAVVFGTAAVLVALLWRRSKSKRDVLPLRWQRVGQVSGLTVYPLKSGRGVSVTTAQCTPLGLVDIGDAHLQLHDRAFIIYNSEKKTAVTGLLKPKVLLMEAHSEVGRIVRLRFPLEEDFLLQLSSIDTSRVVILNRWWGETVAAVDCGDDVARWLSQSLDSSHLRLGYFSQPVVPLRTLTPGWTRFAKVYSRLRSQYLGAYSYMASYLIITEESVEDVNSRLAQPVSEKCYRANITVKGSPAYSEDGWDWLRLGESVVLRGFKPCTRCVVTAIDPDTGKLNPNLEPLHTLKQYRQLERHEERDLSGSEPVFGLYAGLHTVGTVKLGDPVYIGATSN